MEAPLILSWQSLVYSEESQCSHSSYNTPPCEAPMPGAKSDRVERQIHNAHRSLGLRFTFYPSSG